MNQRLQHTPLFAPLIIQGQPQPIQDDLALKVLYPGDGATLVGECALLSKENLPFVLHAALQGFEQYKTTSASQRKTILNQLAHLLEQHQAELTRLITLETGKPITSSHQELQRAVQVCQGYVSILEPVQIEHYIFQDREAVLRYFPLGPVLAITPFNFPLNLVLHKLAAAIAAGTSITIKPSPQAPLTALYLGKLAIEAGYTALNIVPADHAVTEALVQSDVFQKLFFTGSSETGWHLKRLAGKKQVCLELGGNAACIIEDIDPSQLEQVATRVAQGSFSFSGQSCISVQRILIHQQLYDSFLPAFITATRALKVGDPLQESTDIGPLISTEALQNSRNILKEALNQGANVVYGGNTYNMFTLNPTILNRTTPDMRINREEVFSPLVTVTPYTHIEEALTQVNNSRFGLQAGIFTHHPAKAKQAFETLNVGAIIINDVPTYRSDFLPYGGIKDSGHGREGVLSGIQEMSFVKSMITNQL